MNCEETTRKDLAGEEPAETLPTGEPAPEAAAALPEESGPEPADEEEAGDAGEGGEAAGWLVRLRQKLPEGPGGRLIAWLALVAAALLVLVGSALGLLYAITDLDVVPRAGVVFAGQPLNESRWQWKIPVAGPIHRTFRGTFSDEPQRLEEVTVADPELEAESGFDLQLTVKNAGEEVVFEGDSALFASFVFPADGEYTACLTAEKKAGPGSTGHIPEGRYEYDFTFRLNAVPQLELSRESAAQGSVLTLKLTGVLGDTLPRLQADFAPKAVFVQRGRDWVACLDVPYDCPTGSYPVTVTSGENEITREVTVYARQLREIDTQTLDGTALAPFIGALPKGLEPYMEIADPDIYWTDRFVQPVKGTLLRDYYVNEYANRIKDPALTALLPEMVQAYNDAIRPRLSLNVTFSLPAGTPVLCPADGRVIYAGYVNGGGRTLVIEHGGGLKSVFYLLNRLDADEGDFVYQGDAVGTTNHHIICEMRLNGSSINPWDVWRNLGALVTF